MLAKDTHETTVRLAPPLVIEREEIDWALERIDPGRRVGLGSLSPKTDRPVATSSHRYGEPEVAV